MITAGIRSYEQIYTINASRRGLDMVVRASGQLMARQGLREFCREGDHSNLCLVWFLPLGGLVCVQRQVARHCRVIAVVVASTIQLEGQLIGLMIKWLLMLF